MSDPATSSQPITQSVTQSAAPAQPDYADEISLRELYLILRKGLPLILLVSGVTAVAVGIFLSLRSPIYAAESVALVTPPAITVEEVDALSFTPSSEVSFEAYETLANSRGVREAATETLGLTVDELDGGGVTELVAPVRGQPGSLLVTHRVRHPDPETAAELSNAWAQATLNTVRSALLANIQPVADITAADAEARRTELASAEQALATFEASETSLSLEATLARLAELIAAARSEMSMNVGDTLSLQGQDGDVLELTGRNSINLPQAIAATRAELESLETNNAATITINLKRAYLEGLEAQQAALEDLLAEYQQRYETAQAELAEVERERRTLARNLRLAETAFETTAGLRPIINYVSELSPSNASVLSEASVPTNSDRASALLGALIAAIVAGLLSVLFVFLREAVGSPSSSVH